jgi:parallel beta-helix repeat protein
VKIADCVFHNLNDGAIGVYGHPIPAVPGVDPDNITVTGCLFYNTGAVAGLLTDNGIWLKNASNCLIVGNQIRRMARDGIVIEAVTTTGSGNTCKGNVITGNTVDSSNMDNVANTVNVKLLNTSGTVTDIAVVGNALTKLDASSACTHGIYESGVVANSAYVANNVRGPTSAGINLAGGTGSHIANNPGWDQPPYFLGGNSGTAFTPNALNGELQLWTLTGNVTIGAPTNPRTGLRLRFILKQDGTGGRTVTWNAAFLVGSWVPKPGIGQTSEISFIYDGTNWIAADDTPPILTGTATYDPPSLANGIAATTTVTVTGARVSDPAFATHTSLSAPTTTSHWQMIAQVTANDTATVKMVNNTGGTVDLASGTLSVVVIKR